MIDDGSANPPFDSVAESVGDPTDETLTEVEHSDHQFLVTGGTQRSFVGKAIGGSTVQSGLLNTSCPGVWASTHREGQ